jgi:hypothetical protein
MYRIVDLSFKNFATAATTVNYDITGFTGGLLILGAFIVPRINFTGGGAATATMSVGTTGTPTAYVAATTVFSGAQPRSIVGVTQVPGTYLGGAATPLAASTVRIQLICDVNCSLLTAGLADIFMMLAATSARN